jgi:decaprenylphospho-beta-D-erythro-pentofuranosid-2-ulose 2-reductase
MSPSTKILLVLGGTSDIGRATALAFAREGWTVQLAGRDRDALHREAQDISARAGALVSVHLFDVLCTDTFAAFITTLPALPDTVISVVGLLGDQDLGQIDVDHATIVMRSNYEGPALLLGLFADRFLTRGHGTIVGVSSVAGDRGRASNYLYGSAKAGFTAFLSGLRNRCARSAVHVVTIKPGFVHTKMTQGLKLPNALTAGPQEVAAAIWSAVENKRQIIYTRPVWLIIMSIIRLIPERVFMKMRL